MNWDISEEFDAPPQPTTERQMMPAGRHTMEIKHAEEGPNEYKRSDENPDGMCLKLRLSDLDGRYKFVFDDLPQAKSLAWRAKQLASALGITATGETLSLEPSTLVGRTVSVEISHYTSKSSGKVSAVVKKYLDASPTTDKPKAAPAPRTQAAKITASLAPDDIPF